MAGVRLQKRPAEKRTAVLLSGAHDRPNRGEIWSLIEASGIRAVKLNEPLALRSEIGRASCRERVESAVVAVLVESKITRLSSCVSDAHPDRLRGGRRAL